TGFRDQITIEGHDGPFSGVLVRGVIVRDGHASGSEYTERSSGIYAAKVKGLVVEDSIFDRNGWAGIASDRDKYSHNVYFTDDCGPVVIRRTVFSRGSAAGVQLRPGGVIEDSLIYGNAIGGYAARADSVIRRTIFAGNRQHFGVGSTEEPVNLVFEDCIFLANGPAVPGIAEDAKAVWFQHDESTVKFINCIAVKGLKFPGVDTSGITFVDPTLDRDQ